MPTTQVGPGSSLELQDIADTLGGARKVVVITGAGISTNCGIPDFRSEDGLYSLIQAQDDAAVQNPPWQGANTFDIDNRTKKKRKHWYYEVVAPGGEVVDVIDPDTSTGEPEKISISPPTTNIGSRSSTPTANPTDASLPADANPPPRRRPRRMKSGGINSTTSDSTSSTANSRPPYRANSLRHQCAANTLTTSTTTTFTTTATSSEPKEPPLTQTRILQREESIVLTWGSDHGEPSGTQSSQSSRQRTSTHLKGRDLFDSQVWLDAFTTSIFYMFISRLRQKIRNEVKSTTETHKFIKVLRDGGRLVRNYTQNIDSLEEREGLCTDLTRGPGNRARFYSKAQREPRPSAIEPDSVHYGGVEVVLLHGSLVKLRCGICTKLSSWDEDERESATLSGQAPDCPSCTEYTAKRTGNGRRALVMGRLRPDIVLYGEEHPNANLVSPLIEHDLRLVPDVLLIMGTSLKVHGLKSMVKEFAKAVHTGGGKVVFVNRTKTPESTWGDVIDYWVEWDCDAWVLDLKGRRGDIWLPQSAIEKKREPPGDEGTFSSRVEADAGLDIISAKDYPSSEQIELEMERIEKERGRKANVCASHGILASAVVAESHPAPPMRWTELCLDDDDDDFPSKFNFDYFIDPKTAKDKEPTPRQSTRKQLPSPKRWTIANPEWASGWQSSIIYPREGKNRATIDKQDIERLDEGEFLNDNLIVFYLRWLEERLLKNRPELAKRIYFQNTFFYENLTSGKKGINYEAVKRWTSKGDLLTFDYIIVPIHEHTHWYVAIICNAPKLLPSDDVFDSLQGQHAAEKVKDQHVALSDTAKTSVPSPSSVPLNNVNGSHQRVSEGQSAMVTSNLQQSPSTKANKTKNRKRETPLTPRKYNPKQPQIITLDSLGLPHSVTCTNLKKYLVAEIKAKRKKDIPTPGPIGLTVEKIPLQDNDCDCGLFLLSYIETFLEKHDDFIHGLLQNQLDVDIDWPRASVMRERIRDLLLDLQKEQVAEAEGQRQI